MSKRILNLFASAFCAITIAACGTAPPAPPPPTGFVGDVEDFYRALALRESGGNAAVVNTYGYLGLYQMGEPAMMDAAWYDEVAPNETARNDWIGLWLARARNNGVTSRASYLARPAAQDVAVRQYHERVAVYISALGLLAYEGRVVNGIVITKSGLLAACHLLGCGTVAEYLAAPGAGTPADAYGTTIEEYLRLFANYETVF